MSHLRRIFSLRRLKTVLPICLAVMFLFAFTWTISYWILIGRVLFFGLSALFVFGLFEKWPATLPRWLARWVLQVASVALVIPISVWIGYSVTNMGLPEPWWRNSDRLLGFFTFTFLGMLMGPWIAVSALLKQIKDEARNQALAFELERSEFEKQAINARLRLLQAQVEPHFLFNTLANVRELVLTGSPRASAVLDSLIAYLRAAVPQLNEPLTTVGQEIALVRAYLDVMQMRMPDRLQFNLDVADDAQRLICPPMTLLTLVENAMRHGVDPAEDGGRIDVRVIRQGGHCRAEVADTGVGLNAARTSTDGLGTGLANLRERLQLTFGDAATLDLIPNVPNGTLAVVTFPVQIAGSTSAMQGAREYP